MSFKKITLAVTVTASLGAGSAYAAQVSSGYAFTGAGAVSNFTTLAPDGTGAYAPYNGYTFGGTNDVTFTWDGTLFTSSADYTGPGGASNATLSSPTTFYIQKWTAHSVQIFGPGTYTFDTTVGGGVPESGTLTMTVGAGQFGVHLLWDLSTSLNIDIVNVWNLNSTFSNCGATFTDPAASNCLWTSISNTVGNNASTVFLFASADPDGDGTLGVPMAVGGPFPDFNFNFNVQGTLTAVPIPAAVWLFGSGLLGLAGVASRKKIMKQS